VFTRSKKTLAALAVTGAAMLGAGLAAAPAQADGPGNGNGVFHFMNFYQNGGYQGATVSFQGSRPNFSNLNGGNWNDQVTGVWNDTTHGYWVYQDANYQGGHVHRSSAGDRLRPHVVE
jgi:hypothetical protein